MLPAFALHQDGMLWFQRALVAVAAALTGSLPAIAQTRPLIVPFDFSHSAIVLDVSVRGTPLHMFLDTGVSPSAIDSGRAKDLGLKIDYAGGGEASGDGDSAHVMVYPTSIDDLVIGGRRFGAVEALTIDMKPVNEAIGRPIDGTLGHSFLAGKLVLIDYPARTISIFDSEAEATRSIARCHKVWRTPLRTIQPNGMPIVALKIGSARVPVSIDTGSNGNIDLFKSALNEPALKAALAETGSHTATGNRGAYTVKDYQIRAPISLGPFTVAAGQPVGLTSEDGGADTRLANVGNRLFASMQLKLLLDYRENRLGFFGGCAR